MNKETDQKAQNRINDPILGEEIGSFAERLHQIMGADKPKELADQINVSDTSVRKYLKGAVPSLDIGARIADVYGVSLLWLATGKGESSDTSQQDVQHHAAVEFDEEFVLVPGYHVQVSAGNGSCALDGPVKRHLAFRRKYLAYRKLNPDKLAVVFAKGDSMEPTIKDNDSLLVDLSSNTAIDGRIFVVRLGEELYAKRIQKSYDGSILLISDNKEYKEQSISKEKLNDLCIVGQVVQRMTDL
ncbi:S24 family peptidase [Motilimonas sp. 1_MG-2023]|uniref:LexA family transcriptional regulator n=1 Tax=Motilimonas sp. 1_MG-2023 TaxID=3062672 RepID=UPI0026E1371E|nr:S24 family peptidase [Motilimonas sp. 1_MG-2023]MDO6528095.1 S24 family peptidase [Motilimonas sp. 1_MG-2023]